MFNILLDRLPTEYEGFPIDSDFGVGIQILQALEDEELTEQEQIGTALSLLFPQDTPDAQTAIKGLLWFLTDWNHDKHISEDKTKVTDYDIDQWRIYAAFRQVYGINLNTDRLHFWEFMGLLTNLPECAYTRVVDIRAKKITGKMSKEERSIYKKLKDAYSIEQKKVVKYTDTEKSAIDEHDRMIEEMKKKREQKRLAAQAFEEILK
ncbi:MAG: bacteriophage Gp15 family protein [Bacteroidales bacterium]|nr:bacteriophage Gp15 family protein [Lachnoclostridium sp.]MCM1385253.1 bacteriophage Gp15 family protein [Lachnoclostridium sp.]MCM1466161.1 bacteriophage Gp15 family protein [Bacteroidales bacterium]